MISPPKFYHIGLIVTGHGELEFLPKLLRALTVNRDCTFELIRRIGQRSPVISPKRKLKMVGAGKTIPDIDEEEIGLPARRFLVNPKRPNALVILVDDLEGSRRDRHSEVFNRYRLAMDTMLPDHFHNRAAVHFMKNMVEAYYFADASAINKVMGGSLADHPDDVENIDHPKARLKAMFPGFDEITHGEKIVLSLNVTHVLSRADACSSLRTLFAWCSARMEHPVTSRFSLDTGIYCCVTGPQLK